MPLTTKASSSRTALLTAAYRARATAGPDRVCEDVWAGRLVSTEDLDLARRYDRVYAYGELYTAVRTGFIDTEVREALAHRGIEQVIILGAGLDTRAARLARSGVVFFEVDHPLSQADKLRRLGTLGDYPIGAAVYVSCDFERDDFVDRLVASGMSLGAPALLIWEGVTLYLSEIAVRATLRTIAERCHPRSTVLFDFVSRRLVEGRTSKASDREMCAFLEDLGEPILFGTNDPVPLLFEEGFRHVRTVSFDEACLSQTGTYDRGRLFRFQHIAMASRLAPVPLSAPTTNRST